MENHLNLIKTDFKELEKRVFPRFPFTYLTFKGDNGHSRVYEVKDISYTGMQLCLKDGGHEYTPGADISGTLHWRGAVLDTAGTVKWVRGPRLGVAFSVDTAFDDRVRSFLSIENILAGMRPVHQSSMHMELPGNLKYWLQADGPVEIFVWRHNDGEVGQFHIVMLDSFVEWANGKGLKTGKVLTKRDLDTPLMAEDEFVFQMDESADARKLQFAQNIVGGLNQRLLPLEAINFLKVKLGLSTEE